MFYSLNIQEQLKHIINKFKLSDFVEPCQIQSEMHDIVDGQLYKEILNSEDGPLFQRREAFSFLMNTDGISFADKSNLQIWPIFLVINELPLNERFSIENVILAGN